MRRILYLIAFASCAALPFAASLQAQTNSEVGIIIGGSRRFVEGGPEHAPGDLIESNFSLSNSTIDLYYSMQLEPQLNFKIRGGRIQTQVATPYEEEVVNGDGTISNETYRRDFEGEVTHIESVVEYRFSESFGTSALFGGLGYYRQTPDTGDSISNYGVVGGANIDLPISRRYGVVIEGAYHWINSEFDSRYMTLGAGFRARF
jgi:hypothetical protein